MIAAALFLVIASVGVHAAMNTIPFVCWFSSKFWDIHDYMVCAGGDGTPSHFHTYKCWKCGKEFGI